MTIWMLVPCQVVPKEGQRESNSRVCVCVCVRVCVQVVPVTIPFLDIFGKALSVSITSEMATFTDPEYNKVRLGVC